MSPTTPILRAGLTVIGVLVATITAAGPIVVKPADGRTNWFADGEANFGTLISSDDAVVGRLVWVLAVANRTLASDVVEVRHPGGGSIRANAGVAIPAGREGVVVDAEFAAAFIDATGKRLGACSRRVRIFPQDSFASRRRWLESLRIAVIDPSGATEKVLEAAGVPFESVRADADISRLRATLLIVGEGTSWIEFPRLPLAMAAVAAAGTNVLCLAPTDGLMPLPAHADEKAGRADRGGEAVASRLLLRAPDVVADIDGRLDFRDWSDAGTTVIGRLVMAAERDAAVLRASDGPIGWPWLEVGYGSDELRTARGTLIVCGFGVVAHWDETPAARYLLTALLERLAESRSVAAGGPPFIEPPGSVSPEENDR